MSCFLCNQILQKFTSLLGVIALVMFTAGLGLTFSGSFPWRIGYGLASVAL